MERLMGLLRKRALVEKEMIEIAKKMGIAFRAMNRELQVSLEARRQEANEGEMSEAKGSIT
jgi:hypothetical protein